MKKINLTRNKQAIVDDEDFEYLMQWKWRCTAQGYAAREQYLGTIDGKRIRKNVLMHRVIASTPHNLETDHINHDKLDNRKINLRNCSTRQNRANTKPYPRSKSGLKGVVRVNNKWRAILINGTKYIHIGYFHSKIDAAKAYDSRAREIYGEYAYTNF
jgi:hypothetical protein